MNSEKRIAQTNLTCPECSGDIKIGHPYVWRKKQVGKIEKVERVHPNCAKINKH